MAIWGYFISYLGLFLSVGWIFIFRLYTKVEVLWTPKMRGAQCFKPVPRDFDRAHILTFKFSRNCFSNHVGYPIWCLTSTTWQVNDKCIMCMRAAFNFGIRYMSNLIQIGSRVMQIQKAENHHSPLTRGIAVAL